MEKKPVSHLAAGAIVGALIIIYSIVLNFTGLQSNQALAWVGYAILIGGIVYFVNAFGKANGYRLSFGNLFAYGFRISAFVALLVIGFTVLFNIFFPEFKEKIFEMTRQNMVQQGKLTEDQINTAMEMARNFFMVGIIAGSVFFFAVFGAIGSLIGAAITRKDAADTPFENI